MGELLDAATVLLLRPTPEGADAFQVYMVRRHSKSRFMGGMYVFPGGKRDEADSAPEVLAECRGLDGAGAAAILGGPDMTAARAIGHYVAAVRETFEEAGVLLGSPAAGRSADLTGGGSARIGDHAGGPAPSRSRGASGGASLPGAQGADLQSLRAGLHHGTYRLDTVARTLGVTLDLGSLHYFDHWITPEIERRRFSARFFVAAVPAGQRADHDAVETTDGLWIGPGEALARHDRGEMAVPPPTLRVLDRLRRFGDTDAALAACPDAPVPAQAPVLVLGDGLPTLVLPGDLLHPTEAGSGRQRFTLLSGRWHMEFEDPAVSG